MILLLFLFQFQSFRRLHSFSCEVSFVLAIILGVLDAIPGIGATFG